MILAPVCRCGTSALDILRAIFFMHTVDTPKTCMEFWSTVYQTRDDRSALQALVPPNELLEFYHDGVPLTVTDKSFLFACVVGLGPLVTKKTAKKAIMSKQLRFLKPDEDCPIAASELGKLSVCHLLEACEAGRLRGWHGAHILDQFPLQERAQYAREANSAAGFEALQNARWQQLDARFEAVTLPVAELRLTVLVDMCMLLTLLAEDIASPEHSEKATAWASHIVRMALLFLSVAGIGSDVRVAFFLVQLSFQALRCPNRDSASIHEIPEEHRSTPSALAKGWRMLVRGFNASALPQPVQFDYAYLNDLGVWPIFLNPFKLSGRKFTAVEKQQPFCTQHAHESLDEVPFVLDPELFAWSPARSISTNRNQLTLLRKHVTRAFRELRAAEGLPLLKDLKPTLVNFGLDEAMSSLLDWVTVTPAPDTIIGQMTPLRGDPWGVCLRSKLAAGVRGGLGCAFARSDGQFVSKLISRLHDEGPVALLAEWGLQCFCNFGVFGADLDAEMKFLGGFTNPFNFSSEELAPVVHAMGSSPDKRPSSGSVKDRLKWIIARRQLHVNPSTSARSHRTSVNPSTSARSHRTSEVNRDASKSVKCRPTASATHASKRPKSQKQKRQETTDGSQVVLTEVEPSCPLQSRAPGFRWKTRELEIHRSYTFPIGSLGTLICG
ncbi:MAG: uncharacterized protein KVP18_004886 [Porospora cf. gigantea A]|uniref:uncharacterized protein n=1 Tax=Porospora cf. gigantea A TaxID=2853593 RepID=UPI00355A7705|nr:MAG: hypothetical protein KVP18_004886 [Porospora cf. gigantea A]